MTRTLTRRTIHDVVDYFVEAHRRRTTEDMLQRAAWASEARSAATVGEWLESTARTR